MPIRKEFRKFYRGKAWQAVREDIRERAGDRCEQCGVPNHTRVIRKAGWWWNAKQHTWIGPTGPDHGFSGIIGPPRGLRRRIVYIVCACSHINHTPGDDRPENLRFLCNYHHLLSDVSKHRETRQARKDRARPLLQEVLTDHWPLATGH